jgi:hypothetical protein
MMLAAKNETGSLKTHVEVEKINKNRKAALCDEHNERQNTGNDNGRSIS